MFKVWYHTENYLDDVFLRYFKHGRNVCNLSVLEKDWEFCLLEIGIKNARIVIPQKKIKKMSRSFCKNNFPVIKIYNILLRLYSY